MIIRSVTVRLLVFFLAALILPLSASAAPVLSVSPTSISVQGYVGTSLPSQTVQISKTGTGVLKWSVSAPTATWLQVSPTSGQGRENLAVSFPSTFSAAGTYQASFTVRNTSTSCTSTCAVTVNVTAVIASAGAPPPPGASPDGTRVPPASQIIDSAGSVWTIVIQAILRNGQNTGGYGSIITWCGGQIRVFGTDSQWWLWGGAGWSAIGVTDPCVAAPSVTGLSISGPTSVTVGQTAQYTATATYSDSSTQSFTTGPTWSDSPTSLATITQSGVLSALAAGTVNVNASYGGKTAPALAVNQVTPPSSSGVTIYVSPSGSDSNPGTLSSPVRTIQRGVALANQANPTNDVLVSIAAGTYREQVQIFGLSTTKSLTLQGAGPSTILTGADDWSSGWTIQPDGSYVHSWPYRWGMKPIPNGWGEYWNWDGKGYKRDRLRRSEMVYVNGSPLTGVLTLAELSAPGTFYVDETNALLRMRPPAGVSLTGSLVEVGTRLTPLAINGRNNVTVRNLAVMRNRGAVQDDAFHTANLQNLTLDGLVVQWTAYTGVSAAYITGLHIRNSLFSDNGVDAITGIGNNDILFEDSEVSRNNWRGWPAEHKGFDTVGKWSESRDVVVRNSRFTDNWGHGPWFDGDNQRVLVDNVFSARNALRGISLEYNGGPLTIQNSKFCENGLVGVSNARSNNTSLLYNQIFNNGQYQIMATGSPTPVNVTDTRTGAQYAATGGNWTITNNIIRGRPLAGGDPPDNSCYPGPCGWVFWTATDDNDIYYYIKTTMTSDYNQWYHSSTTKSFRVPDTYGQAVDLPTFRTLMSTVKPNDVHSLWSNSLAVSCTP